MIGSTQADMACACTDMSWTNPNNVDLYKMPCAYRISWDGNTTQSQDGISEYNFNHLVVPLNNENIGDIHVSYKPITGYHYDNSTYSNASLQSYVIRCDDDCFSVNVDYAGSSGNPLHTPAQITATNSKTQSSTSVSCNQNWYYASARYTIDGCYTSKIIHVPSSTYQFDIKIGKYLCEIASEIDGWHEAGRAQSSYTSNKDFNHYITIQNISQRWNSTTYNTNNRTYTKSVRIDKDLIPTEVIADEITCTNTASVNTLHVTTLPNKDNRVKYQMLCYAQSTNASSAGYHKDMYINPQKQSVRTPYIILVQEPSVDKFIYWGMEQNKTQCRRVIGYEYTDMTQENVRINVDFNMLNFATLDTIQNKLNNILWQYNDSIKDTPPPRLYNFIVYVAIPQKYYGKYKPTVTGSIYHSYDSLIVKNTNGNPYFCTFNNENYYVYMWEINYSTTYTNLKQITLTKV